MVARQRHRGPDDCGVAAIDIGDNQCVLGNSRLSIIDLSLAGHMPMYDRDTGNWIAYNGEIYNFTQLRTDLERSGARFVSRTDTEVILRGYALLGPRILDRMRGMFALAIWDASARELFIARDRAGEKPLYYHEGPDAFLFASEVRTLLESGLVRRELDPAALELFLANGFVVSPTTMIRGVRSLLPAHWMRVNAAGQVIEQARYWQPSPDGPEVSERLDGQIAESRALLEETVRQCTVSDVPLGVFLSGGLDSSSIAALLARTGSDIRTFSISFPGNELDESRFSQMVANAVGTRHTEVQLDETTFWDWIPGALESMDQPTFDGVNSYCVARAAKEGGLTVALSGIGSDELFGGYPFFRTAHHVRSAGGIIRRAPKSVRRRLARIVQNGRSLERVAGPWKLMEFAGAHYSASDPTIALIASYQVAQLLFPTWARESLLHADIRESSDSEVQRSLGLTRSFVEFLGDEIRGAGPGNGMSVAAWRLFLGERCLRDTDSMSMGTSLEVRAPFVDHVLVQRLLTFSSSVRCAGAPDKPFAWRLFEPYLRGALPQRRKQGFVFPFREWLRSETGRRFLSVASSDDSLASIGLERSSVRFVFDQFRSAPDQVPWSRAWSLAVLIDWCRRHRVTL